MEDVFVNAVAGTPWGAIVAVFTMPWLIIGWLIRRLFTGDMVTRREVDQIEARCAEWRQIALKSMGHTDSLVKVAETTKAAIEALPKSTGRPGG